MKVAVYYSNSDVRVEERDVPKVGAGELLFKVEACGLCGSDVMEWYRKPKAPLVLGHEAVGTVEEVDEGVKRWKKGDRVFVSHHVPCGFCRYCRAGHETVCDTLRKTNFDPGGFAQFVRVPMINIERGVFSVPGEMGSDIATFIEPLGCAHRGQRHAGMAEGKSVLVIGCGIAGMLHLKLAAALGASRMFATDLSEYRRMMAERDGAVSMDARDDVPAKLRKANGGLLADLVIVCAGAPAAAEQAFRCVERGGTILFFTSPAPDVPVPVPVFDVWKNEVSVATAYGAAPLDIDASIELLRSRRVKVEDMITHRLPMDRVAEGFALVAGAGESMKVIIHPNE